MYRSLFGALVLGALLIAPTVDGAAKSPRRANGKISFWSDRMGDRAEVYVMNADGTRQRRITSLFSAKRAAFSSDGKRIAFDGRAYATLFDFDVFVANVDGSHVRRITRGPERDLMPAWSPDGTTIALSRQSTEDAIPELWLVGADGTGAHKLVDGGMQPSWSPDGAWIVYAGASVSLVRPDGSDAHTIASGGEPSWSPDGRRVVFVRGGDVWTMDADGTHQRRLTRGPAEELTPTFSPDGRWILFTSDRTGNKDVFVMRLDGSGVRDVSRHPASDWSTSWQPLVR